MMRRSNIFIFALLFLFLFPCFAFSALDLEEEYPDIPGAPTIESVVKETSLPKLVKYYASWAIIIAIVVVAVSMILGGLQYLIAAGRPAVAAGAKQRITNAFLGLAILLSSYLILRIVNPQIEIFRVEKAPVSSGIILLTKNALEGQFAIEGETKKGCLNQIPNLALVSIEELIELKEAAYLYGGMADLKDLDALGMFKAVEWDAGNEVLKVNFEKFKAYAVGFWGPEMNNAEVIFYADENYQGEQIIYTFKGKMNDQGEIERGLLTQCGTDPMLSVIALEPDFVATRVRLLDPGPPGSNQQMTGYVKEVLHPPISFQVRGMSWGVYLYAEDLGQKYFLTSHSNLKLVGFDDKAEKIEIINENPETGEQEDFLAILHEDVNYRGKMRIFFQKREVSFIPKIYFEEEFAEGEFGALRVFLNLMEGGPLNIFSPGPSQAQDFQYESLAPAEVGNVPRYDPDNPGQNKAEVSETDRYGKSEEPSSIEIYRLNSPIGGCREVELCTETHRKGYCISYTNRAERRGVIYNRIYLPTPWYVPVNIPKEMKGTVLTEEGEDEITVEFAKNIRSIYIDGQCLVVLFSLPLKYKDSGSLFSRLQEWDKGSPGDYSEVFTGTGDLDLTDSNPIGRCTGYRPGSLELGDVSPCASAIVVFPLK